MARRSVRGIRPWRSTPATTLVSCKRRGVGQPCLHGAGGTVAFVLPATGNITTLTHNTNGILGAWATVYSQTQNGTVADWAANSGVANAAGGNNITPYLGYTYDYTDSSGAIPTTNYGWAPGNNTSTIGTYYQSGDTIAAGSTTNSLRIANVQNFTITLAGLNTITSGGILVTNDGYGATGSNRRWRLNRRFGPRANELAITIYPLYYGPTTLQISATIVDNGSHAMGLGSGGVLMLTSAANSYGGPTTISPRSSTFPTTKIWERHRRRPSPRTSCLPPVSRQGAAWSAPRCKPPAPSPKPEPRNRAGARQLL